jgi:hypothetical protein
MHQSGPWGERSSCTHIRQALGSWQYRASVFRRISRLVVMCLIWRLFETGRRTGLMPPRNRLTASLGAPHAGPGLLPDGETCCAEGQPAAALMW